MATTPDRCPLAARSEYEGPRWRSHCSSGGPIPARLPLLLTGTMSNCVVKVPRRFFVSLMVRNAPVLILGQTVAVPSITRRNNHISDLMIDGNRANQTSECMGGPCGPDHPLRNNGISIRRCEDCRVERVTIFSASSGGLVTELTCRGLTVRDYTSFDNQFDGLAAYEPENSTFSGSPALLMIH
jgi:hypothetical protein